MRVDDIHKVFGRKEERQAELDLLVDYTGLLGPHFISAKQDIRPYLPDGVLDLDDGPADGKTECRRSNSADTPASDRPDNPAHETECSHTSGGADRRGSSNERQDVGGTPVFPVEDMLALQKCLQPTEVPPAELESWLCKKVAAVHQESNHPLVHWCWHWYRGMEESEHYQDQKVTQ